MRRHIHFGTSHIGALTITYTGTVFFGEEGPHAHMDKGLRVPVPGPGFMWMRRVEGDEITLGGNRVQAELGNGVANSSWFKIKRD